jgi:DNA invertase Pin-like site-specific DNA recombinase
MRRDRNSRGGATKEQGSSLLRCAIYTRVSTEHGLEQEFNSLDAQREASEAYIKSQAHEGWRLLPGRYDDGGFSGGSLERPAVKLLLDEVRARKVDVIVVYKVDRLTRSLADFAKLVELFDEHGVSFVSVTQAFNTTTSMGRLTLNVLLSFAQFEREVTGERIRDKIAASKQKGIWMGGTVPLGYRVESRKLLIVEEEAETVRLIFSRYLELGSLPALQNDLRERGLITRRRPLSSGKIRGGVPFTTGPLHQLLTNRIYLGEINHRNRSWPGEHLPIVERELFDAAQDKLAANRNSHHERLNPSDALLAGRIFDDRGNRMTPSHAKKGPARYRYYVSLALAKGRKEEAGTVKRAAAADIDQLVLEALRNCVAGRIRRPSSAQARQRPTRTKRSGPGWPGWMTGTSSGRCWTGLLSNAMPSSFS